MTDPAAPPRPRQVTFSAAMIMFGAVFVVLTVFERVAGLQSLETQEAVEQFLAEPPGDGLGLDVQGVIDVLRVLAMVAGAAAAAMGVLGYFVLQRSRPARVALSVLAVPLFVAGMATGGFMSSVVVVAAVMLWFQPARDWFDGITPEPRRDVDRPASRPAGRETGGERGRERGRERVDAAVSSGSSSAPSGSSGASGAAGPSGPAQGSGGAGPAAYPDFGAPQPGGSTATAWPAAPASSPGVPATRPNGVVAACVVTWLMSSLALVTMAISVVVLATSPGAVYDELISQNPELADQGVSEQVLVEVTYVLGAIVILWALGAIALAVLVFRRVGWARPVLMASAGVAGLFCLLAVAVGQLPVLLPLAACVLALALLARPDVAAWFRR